MNYLLTSNDPLLMTEALNKLIFKLLPVKDDLNFNLYNADTDELQHIISTAATMPFASKKRVLVIKRADSFKQKDLEIICKFIKNTPSYTEIIFVAQTNKSTKLWKELLANVKAYNIDIPVGNKLNCWIKEQFESEDKEISQEALILLKEFTGEKDLSDIKNEIQKLIVYSDKRKNIIKEDINTVVGKRYEEDVFSIVNEISVKNSAKALSILERLFQRKVSAHEVIGPLGWFFRQMLSGKRRTSLSGVKIHKSIEILLSTDVSIKTSKTDPQIALEIAILRLCKL